MEAQVEEGIERFAVEPDAYPGPAFLGEVEARERFLAQVDADRGGEIPDFLLDFLEYAFAVAAFRVAEVEGVAAFGRDERMEGFVCDELDVLEPRHRHLVQERGGTFHVSRQEYDRLGAVLERIREVEGRRVFSRFFEEPAE